MVEELRMKRAADKKDRKAFKGSRHNNELARLAQRNAARHRGSRKAARENRKKEHRRRGHNSSGAIVVVTPNRKFRGRLSCSGSRAGCSPPNRTRYVCHYSS